ncbi:MAG: zinc ABC transporter solute-binding protein [Candidatus Thioglobus sp.]|nr:zinc ABC transporter solute-binding protein [Candidatus Thioglobus sp.]
MNFRLFLITFCLATSTFATPNIAVSIKPLNGIVTELTLGITTPKLLLKSNNSAHNFHLKPTQLLQINSADLVVFVHPNFEINFKKVLKSIKNDKKISLSQGGKNHHLWLDVEKMIEFSQRLSQKLIQIDGKNQAIYITNLKNLMQKLQTLKAEIRNEFIRKKQQKVISFSNAFAYFLSANGLENSLIISDNHGDRMSLFKILNARKSIKKSIKSSKKNQAICLLHTTQTPKKSIKTLTENLPINIENIDIIGNGNYFKLMRKITSQVSRCLR